MMRQYEATFFFNPDLDENMLSSEITICEELIKNIGGKMNNRSIPTKTEMGYRIKKKKEGYLVIFTFECEPAKIQELSQALNLKETILRFTIIIQKQKEAVL